MRGDDLASCRSVAEPFSRLAVYYHTQTGQVLLSGKYRGLSEAA